MGVPNHAGVGIHLAEGLRQNICTYHDPEILLLSSYLEEAHEPSWRRGQEKTHHSPSQTAPHRKPHDCPSTALGHAIMVQLYSWLLNSSDLYLLTTQHM
jgi:hypothetical protein